MKLAPRGGGAEHWVSIPKFEDLFGISALFFLIIMRNTPPKTFMLKQSGKDPCVKFQAGEMWEGWREARLGKQSRFLKAKHTATHTHPSRILG